MDNEIKHNSRNAYYDMLRLIACLMVIVLHTLADGIYDKWSSEKTIMVIMQCLSCSAVPIFFMLSGSLSTSPNIKKYLKKVMKFIILFIVFKILYAFWDCYYYDHSISFLQLYYDRKITDLNSFKFHLWYLKEYIILLLFTPIINSADAYNKKTSYYISIIFIIFCIVSSISFPIKILNRFEINPINAIIDGFSISIPEGIGYFCIGKALSSLVIRKKEKLCHSKLPIILCTFAYLIVNIFTIIITVQSSISKGTFDYSFLSRKSISVFLSATLLFLLFTLFSVLPTQKSPTTFFCRTCELIVPCTLYIYLIHPFFIDLLNITINFTARSFNPLFSVPLKSTFVFLLSLFFSAIIFYSSKLSKQILSLIFKRKNSYIK